MSKLLTKQEFYEFCDYMVEEANLQGRRLWDAREKFRLIHNSMEFEGEECGREQIFNGDYFIHQRSGRRYVLKGE